MAIETRSAQDAGLLNYINLKLAALGQQVDEQLADSRLFDIARPLLRNHYQKDLLLGNRLCPADTRIQLFLDNYLSSVAPEGAPRLPSQTFVLDRAGACARHVAARPWQPILL